MNNFESKTILDSDENVSLIDNIFNKIINLNDESNKTELIEALVSLKAHYGHSTNTWNPLMSRYLFAEHGGVHIIDLTKTLYLLKNVLNHLIKLFSESNARILFVGSKEQLIETIKLESERCGQYYVNYRWLGGTLTNWHTIQKSIKKMDMIEREIYENQDQMSKREIASKQRVLTKLQNSLGGIRNMSNLPDIIFVTDTKKEKVAIAEANKLGIPVIALLDSNSNPRGVDYPIPCNDDNQKAVAFVTQLISDAVLVGMEVSFSKKEAASKQRREEKTKLVGQNVQVKRKSFVRGGSTATGFSGGLDSSNNKDRSDSSLNQFENSLELQQNQDELLAQFENEINLNNIDSNKEISASNVKNASNADVVVGSGLKSHTSIQAKLKKSFVTPQKNNKMGGGFSSAAANLLKKNSSTSSSSKQINNISDLDLK